MVERLRRHQRVVCLCGTCAFFLVLFLLLLNFDMRQELDVDEHQFIAAGTLASHFLIPYRDFPYHHTPYLPFVYGAMFTHTDYLLLSARGLCTLCDFAALAVIFCVTSNLFRERQDLFRFFMAAGAVLLLLTNPLFAYTSGHAWNHAIPELATLVAFVLQNYGVRQREGTKWVFMSGALLGFATGVRITFALAVIPLAILIFLSPDTTAPRTRLRLLFSFAAGVGLAILPALLMLALYPHRFIFGVIRYPQLDAILGRRIWFVPERYKVTYFFTVLRDPGNLVLGFSFVLSILALRATDVRARIREHLEVIAVLIVVPCLLIGSFVKPPYWEQYFYAPVPFLVLGLLYVIAIASTGTQERLGKWLLQLFALAVLVSSVYGLPQYAHVRHRPLLDAWVPIQIHHVGAEIRRVAGTGRVMTLAPIFPLEGQTKIYCELAAGPFTWRVAPLIPEADRRELGLVSPDNLSRFLQRQAPGAVLVGFDEKLETPFVRYAMVNGYKSVRLSNGADLWLPAKGGAMGRENESTAFCR